MVDRMRILLTGGCGFIGHHVVEGLLKQTDWEIIILDSLTYAGSLNRVVDIDIYEEEKKRVKFVWHDLRSPISETVHTIIGRVDYVWHLAAESHVENSLKDAVPFAYNVVVTTNLLEYLKEHQKEIRRYIGFGTDEVFGPAPPHYSCSEIYKFYPSNPYSASKAGQWAMEYAFYRSFKMPIILVHCMNVFGERQHPEKFVPMTVRNILSDNKVTIHGMPGDISSRCWIHARSVCDALLFLVDKGKIGETYNIVGKEGDVEFLALRIGDIIGKEIKLKYVDFHRTRPGHDKRYALDGRKLKTLGWVPQFTVSESLEKTVHWMIRPENRRWLFI